MKLAGIEQTAREKMAARDAASDDVEVLWENRTAVMTFLDCATQWRIGPMGGYLGLDYPGVESVIRMRGIKRARDTFARIRVIESAALGALNQELSRKRK